MQFGKWWGDKNSKERPILAIHGWQDNAGSFDRLIQLMKLNRPVLAIDIPGHGWSSPIYPTMVYHDLDMVLVIRRIQLHYGWDQVTLLGHSMGSIVSFLFAALYPNLVDTCINLDVLKPIESDLEERADKMGALIDKIIDLTQRIPSQKGNASSELQTRWINGTNKSLSEASAQILMKRGIKEIHPGQYIYSRDHRLKAGQLHVLEPSENINLAKNIKCNILYIHGNQSPFLQYCTSRCPDIIETLQKNAKSFQMRSVEGTHHFHINQPELVAPIIVNYLTSLAHKSTP